MPARTHPPLRVWLFVMLVTGLSVALLGREELTNWLQLGSKHDTRFNLDRLTSAPVQGLHVVAVGTSKIRCALTFDENFPVVKVAGRPPLILHRVSVSSATFASLHPVFTALLEHPPDVLLLESDLLLHDRQYGQEYGWLSSFRDNVQQIKSLTGLNVRVGHNYGEETWPSEAGSRKLKSPEARLEYAKEASVWRISTPAQRLPYLEVLRTLSRQGTRIVLLDLPRAPHANQLVPSGLDSQAHDLRDRILREEGFAYWSPGELAEDWYLDQGHLNPIGRRHYSAWLSERLANVESRRL